MKKIVTQDDEIRTENARLRSEAEAAKEVAEKLARVEAELAAAREEVDAVGKAKVGVVGELEEARQIRERQHDEIVQKEAKIAELVRLLLVSRLSVSLMGNFSRFPRWATWERP